VATLAGKGTGRKSHFDIFTRGAWERGLEREGGGIHSFADSVSLCIHYVQAAAKTGRANSLSDQLFSEEEGRGQSDKDNIIL
jgi:hypothetical protein